MKQQKSEIPRAVYTHNTITEEKRIVSVCGVGHTAGVGRMDSAMPVLLRLVIQKVTNESIIILQQYKITSHNFTG